MVCVASFRSRFLPWLRLALHSCGTPSPPPLPALTSLFSPDRSRSIDRGHRSTRISRAGAAGRVPDTGRPVGTTAVLRSHNSPQEQACDVPDGEGGAQTLSPEWGRCKHREEFEQLRVPLRTFIQSFTCHSIDIEYLPCAWWPWVLGL